MVNQNIYFIAKTNLDVVNASKKEFIKCKPYYLYVLSKDI